MMSTFYLLLTNFLLVSSSPTSIVSDSSNDQVLEKLSSSWLENKNDFIQPLANSELFPFTKSKVKNHESSRDNYEKINNDEEAAALTSKLQEWRGFERLDQNVSGVFQRFTGEFENFSSDLKSDILSKFETGQELEGLPSSWFKFVEENQLDVSVESLVKFSNEHGFDTASLYKILILLRDLKTKDRNDFVSRVNVSDYLAKHVGYLLGYRWDMSGDTDLPLETMMTLPSDVILNMSEEIFEGLDMKEKLKDKDAFMSASQEKQNAWTLRFGPVSETEEYAKINDVEKFQQFGHLLNGAGLGFVPFIQNGTSRQVIEDGIFHVLDNIPISPIRASVMWEMIKQEDREKIFARLSKDLDITQLLAHYNTSEADEFKHHREVFESSWFSSRKFSIAWVNAMFVGLKAMTDEHLSSWTAEDIKNFGKFVRLLSPAEIEQLGADSVPMTEELVSSLVSPSLSLAQLTAIYKRYKAQMSTDDQVMDPVHPLLLSALSSADITSPEPHFIWSQDKEDLLKRSALFTPGQMRALHEIMYPWKWSAVNMSAIVSNHPACLSEVTPKEIKLKLDSLIDGIASAGQDKFYSVAKKMQMIPRHLKMAWLEGSLEELNMTQLIDTAILLDRPTADTEPEVAVENPQPSHPLASVFDRWAASDTIHLTSFALAGLSCDQINKIKTEEMFEVYAMFRYQMSQVGMSMPSSTRKCWANKLREYLLFKAMVYNVTITTETELLSLLTTAEIKTLGGELLLTWGGPVLSSILNPEVAHEVLMEVALTKPSYYLANGVMYSCLKEMARALFKIMEHHEDGKVDLMVLSHVHNLVPFAGNEILGANNTDLKHFVRTVLNSGEKTMCLMKEDREMMRNLLIKAYGPPQGWDSLDLIEMGDLLTVMKTTDLGEVSPTSVRMAASELASATQYSKLVSEVRGATRPVMYHEACLDWLGGAEGRESEESLLFHQQWVAYNHFIIVGNFLQFEIMEQNFTNPKPRSEGTFGADTLRRRRRQAVTTTGPDYRAVYSVVMAELSRKFSDGELSEEQKREATTIITSTQSLLANTSFQVLGLERGELSQEEVLGVLAEYRNSGNMTQTQNNQIQQLAVDTQIRMIQLLVPLLGLNKDSINMTEEQFSNLMALETFDISTPEVTTPVPVPTEELLSTASTTTPASSGDQTTLTTTPASSEDQTTSTTVSSTDSSTVSTEFPDNFREPRDESTTESNEVTDASAVTTDTTEASTTTEAALVTEASSTEATTPATTEATSEEAEVTTEQSTTEDTETTSVEAAVDSSSEATTEASTTTVETTKAPEVTTVANTKERLAEILASNELLAFSTFLDYEPDTDNFDKIPALDSVILTCDMLTASGDAASSISSAHLSSMASADLMNCIETLGRIHWPEAAAVSIWKELKAKLALFQDPSLKPIKRDLMIQLHNLLPAIATHDADLIDVTEDNIDGISLIGMHLRHQHNATSLVQEYISTNQKSASKPLSITEAASLGQLLCGLTEVQWEELITPASFPSLVTAYLAPLECSVSPRASTHLSSLLVTMYGAPETWNTSDVLSVGWLASTLSPAQLNAIPSHAIEGLTGNAVKFFTGEHWAALSPKQLKYLSPHAASFVTLKKLESMDKMTNLREIRAAIGEDPSVMEEMKEFIKENLEGSSDVFKPSIIILSSIILYQLL